MKKVIFAISAILMSISLSAQSTRVTTYEYDVAGNLDFTQTISIDAQYDSTVVARRTAILKKIRARKAIKQAAAASPVEAPQKPTATRRRRK